MEEHVQDHLEEEETYSFLDLLLVITRNRRIIAMTTAVCVAFALVVAIFSPSEYTASAKVIRETAVENPGGLTGGLAALRGLGITIGGTSAGLTAETYPDILRSREVRLAVARSQFYFHKTDSTMSLVDHHKRSPGVFILLLDGLKKATIGLPGTIMGLFRDKSPGPIVLGGSGELLFLTEEEEDTIRWLTDVVSIGVDRTSGIMSISVTTHDPLLSAQLAQILTDHLTDRVREIYTEKTRENLEFIQERFLEAEGELEEAEEELARFMDRNRNPETERLRTARDRLQRKVTFKTQLYSDLQTQLTQAEIELPRSQPVITLVEAPVPPLEPSGPRRKVIVLVALFSGLMAGTGLGYVKTYMGNLSNDQGDKSKLEEIKAAFALRRLLRRR